MIFGHLSVAMELFHVLQTMCLGSYHYIISLRLKNAMFYTDFQSSLLRLICCDFKACYMI